MHRFYEKHYQDNNFELKKKENIVEKIGQKVFDGYKDTINFIDFVGKVFYYFV